MSEICENRKARFRYQVLDTIEVGIVLSGSEVKSLRADGANISEAFAIVANNELWLISATISQYKMDKSLDYDQTKRRKLLASRSEIDKLRSRTAQEGLTLVPLKLYWKGNKVKALLGLCKGKNLVDKRQTIKDREQKRQLSRLMKG